MSNFKEMYPQKNFIEDLHRMYSIGTDDYMVWAYEGEVEEAPITSDYVYQLIKNTKQINGVAPKVTDGIEMPIESLKIYGNTIKSKNGTMSSPCTLTNIGKANTTSNLWETTITDGKTRIALSHEQPLCKLNEKHIDYYKDGALYYNTVYTILNAESDWQIDLVYSNNKIIVISLFLPEAEDYSVDLCSTHFTTSEDLTVANHIKIQNQRLYITANRTKIATFDKFIEWLSKNKVKVIYNRKNTKKVLIEPSILLFSYEGTTTFSNDQNALMDIEYRIAPNARLWQRQKDRSFKEITS